jgi:hypothetical protein
MTALGGGAAVETSLQLVAVGPLSNLARSKVQGLFPAGEPVSVDKRKAHFSSATARRSAYFETDKVCVCVKRSSHEVISRPRKLCS